MINRDVSGASASVDAGKAGLRYTDLYRPQSYTAYAGTRRCIVEQREYVSYRHKRR